MLWKGRWDVGGIQKGGSKPGFGRSFDERELYLFSMYNINFTCLVCTLL